MRKVNELPARLDRILFGSLRARLVLGLLPGFLALLTLLGVGLYAANLLVDTSTHIADTGWELAATRSLQLKLQQTLIPLNDYVLGHDRQTSRQQFAQLADDLEQVFAEAEPRYEESEEQVLLAQARVDWQTARAQAEQIFAAPDRLAEPDAEVVAAMRRATRATWQNLEGLHDAVLGEMERTVRSSQATHNTASGLLVASTLLAFVLGLLFVVVFSRHITRPVQALEVGAARIGGGDLAFRVDLQRQDEIGSLAREFNRMAEQLQDAYQHLEERVAERTNQLRVLHEASQSVVSERQLERVLQTIAHLARALGNAAYAAVLVPRQEEDQPPRFIVSHDPALELPAALSTPQGRGLLGHLLAASAPIRLAAMERHPAAAGMPPGHPPMGSFLGVPIRLRQRTIGGLYLTDRPQGKEFGQEEEELLTMLAAYAGIAIENARLYEQLTQMNEALEAQVQERTARLEAVSLERSRYAAQLRQVLNRTVQVQEAERQRIAQDIHDGVSQWLMGALFELQAARVRLPAPLSEVEHHLSEAQRVLKEVKKEMRRVIYDLHPPLLESNGLLPALRGHLVEVESHCDLRIRLTVLGEARPLAFGQELALFRIAQEAITNVIKHAASERAEVTLDFQPQAVCLRIADAGRGFDPARGHNGSGQANLGLLSMQERATSVGATLDVQSAPGQGTRVTVQVPLEQPGPYHVEDDSR